MEANLTRRQEVFIAEFLVTRNGAESARRAGYSSRTARQMATENLSKPSIRAALAVREAQLAARLALTRQGVIKAILDAIQTAKEQGEPATCIRGWMVVAKMAGLDKPEPHQDRPLSPGAERIRSKFEAMSTSELLEILAAKDVPVT
ncbi:MAG: terminase small subunit [Sulfuritalea sp.]|nr:terminase small subunit [Sulfuritalea sp.]